LEKDAQGISYVDYLQEVVVARPMADPRFEIIRSNADDYKRNMQIDLLARSIAKLEKRLENLTQVSARDAVSRLITLKNEQLEKIIAGEDVDLSNSNDEIALEALDMHPQSNKNETWGDL
jgi:hypothetical protein